jgi:Sigma-70 region 2
MLQEAFAAAPEQWPRAGPPRNPCAWLVSTARHKAIDRLRREKSARSRRRVRGEPIERRAQRLVLGECMRLEGREATHQAFEHLPHLAGPQVPEPLPGAFVALLAPGAIEDDHVQVRIQPALHAAGIDSTRALRAE